MEDENLEVNQMQRSLALQQELEEVAQLMEENLWRLLERTDKMEELDRVADALQASAGEFQKTAKKVQNKFMLMNKRWTIILVVTIVVALVVCAAAFPLAKYKPWQYLAKKLKTIPSLLGSTLNSTKSAMGPNGTKAAPPTAS